MFVNQRSIRAWVTAICLAFALTLVRAVPIVAQTGGVNWSDPVHLSDSLETAMHPAILADPYGVVHVFWSESTGGGATGADERGGTPVDTIMYRRWDGTSWSGSVSILSVRGDPLADFVAVDIDDEGIIHVTWTGLVDTYYSWAPSWKADDVYAWARPTIIAGDNARTMRESYIATSQSGDVHVIYATRGTTMGVRYIALREGTSTWSLPVTISAPLDPLERGYSNVRLIVDSEGRLHATWQTFQDEGYGQAVYYSRSVDDGVSWSMPTLLRYRQEGDKWIEWPYVTAAENDNLYLIYVESTNVGRAFRMSHDAGETWSEERKVFTELEGINGYVVPLVDGEGQLHVIANMRTRTQIGGIYYLRWIRGGFTMAEPIVLEHHSRISDAIHYTAATVRLGNELHLVWHELDGNEIWYIRGILEGVEPTPAEPSPAPSETTEVDLETTMVPIDITETSRLTETFDEAAGGKSTDNVKAPAQAISTWTPMIVAGISAALTLIVAIVWRTSNR